MESTFLLQLETLGPVLVVISGSFAPPLGFLCCAVLCCAVLCCNPHSGLNGGLILCIYILAQGQVQVGVSTPYTATEATLLRCSCSRLRSISIRHQQHQAAPSATAEARKPRLKG